MSNQSRQHTPATRLLKEAYDRGAVSGIGMAMKLVDKAQGGEIDSDRLPILLAELKQRLMREAEEVSL